MSQPKSALLIYQSDTGGIKIDVRLEEDTVWLPHRLMAELFKVAKSTITEHIKNIYDEGELNREATVRNFRTVQIEGNRSISRDVEHYNLDMIISVGYRVKSRIATQFRIWATQRLKEYIVKGFALNDERFKTGNSMNYFNELQDRLREDIKQLKKQYVEK